ncbi:unnamed protein product [Cuscuta epithymum]|uniref:Expansin-like EG45 domain-containing protein n=1 Tax=Cuscuta epithymum TaxID=186058 RepID=A0AAV0D6C4_9ASTE|nr:unnamed protein product [Cuscuta epithymum]
MAFARCIIFFMSFLFNFCSSHNANATLNGFSPAIATWYGPPDGHGTDTGACGYGNVSLPPYNSMVSAGNQALYKSGKGCGECYKVKCTENPICSRKSIKVYITDECPGACNNEPVWFDMGGRAFGYMGKPGQADAMRNLGRVKIWYKSVSC